MSRYVRVILLLAVFAPGLLHAQTLGQESTVSSTVVEKAQVILVTDQHTRTIPGTDTIQTYQTLTARVLSGVDSGKEVAVENDYLVLVRGDVFFLTHTIDQETGTDAYTVLEPDRLPALGMLLAFFILAVVLVGGWTGVRGLLALATSILLVFYVLLPGIAGGYNPLVVSFVVSGIIVVIGSYLTHGINRTTSAAVLGLLVTVGVTAAIASVAVHATRLSGFSDESTVYLNFATHGHIDFVALLLGAMLVGALGILYDAAIGQAVAVEELIRAAPQAPRTWIFARAMRIGREHIGALVNTLAIAYVGVALPLLLLFQSYGGEPFLQTINRETFAVEIVRAIVGSIGIVLAVPLSTLAAIFLLTTLKSKDEPSSSKEQHH